jgi:succinyl-diaminopimelate desuccinylase
VNDLADFATIEFAQRLVRIESFSRSSVQSEVLDLIAGRLQASHELRVTTRDGRPVALAALPRASARPLLVFSGHVDVVPVDDRAEWERDPFGGEISAGRLWGRGSSDMKSGIAAIVGALTSPSGHTAGALFTLDEEIGSEGAGTAGELLAGIEVGALVIAEPTDGIPLRGHKGVTWLRVRVAGVAAHGSAPHLGENAIRALANVLERAHHVVDPQWDTMNVGLISGGSAPNIVPASAAAVVDLRTTTPGSDVAAWWRAQPEIVAVEVELDLRAVVSNLDDPVLAELDLDIADRLASYFTDASVLADALSCERVVLWGPGEMAEAHKRDESAPVEAILEIEAAYLRTIERWHSAA